MHRFDGAGAPGELSTACQETNKIPIEFVDQISCLHQLRGLRSEVGDVEGFLAPIPSVACPFCCFEMTVDPRQRVQEFPTCFGGVRVLSLDRHEKVCRVGSHHFDRSSHGLERRGSKRQARTGSHV